MNYSFLRDKIWKGNKNIALKKQERDRKMRISNKNGCKQQ